MRLSDYFRPAVETFTHTQTCMHVSPRTPRQLHILASTCTRKNKGALNICTYNCDFLHHQVLPQNAACLGMHVVPYYSFIVVKHDIVVCIHAWTHVTGRPAETCVLRVAPGNAGESNLGSMKAGKMCLSAPREPVSWFLFDRLKRWHQPAPQPPPPTTPSSWSNAAPPVVHISVISDYFLFFQCFPHMLEYNLYCMCNDTYIYRFDIFYFHFLPL